MTPPDIRPGAVVTGPVLPELIEILVYVPTGSGALELKRGSGTFAARHAARVGNIAIYGQESNCTAWRVAKMNLAMRGIDGRVGHADTFHNVPHTVQKAEFILANPPFSISDCGGKRLRADKRWRSGAA